MPELAERPKIAEAPLSVVLVCYNAGNELVDVLTGWNAYLVGLNRAFEIILVDDGSSDGSGTVAESLRSDFAHLQVYRHETRRGLGAALRTGIVAAQHSLLFYSTCNKQYQPNDLKKLLDSIDKVDIVTGYRIWLPVPGWYALLRGITHLIGKIVFGLPFEVQDCWLGRNGLGRRFIAWWLLRVRLADPECPYRLCRRTIFERIPIQSDGIFSQIEIMAKANFLGLYLAEVPVTYVAQRGCDESLGVAAAARNTRRDIWRVIATPDFGPAPRQETVLAAEPASTA